jgi:hypothetical protein
MLIISCIIVWRKVPVLSLVCYSLELVLKITKLTSDPFAGGTFDLSAGKFVPGSEYASYGAQR